MELLRRRLHRSNFQRWQKFNRRQQLGGKMDLFANFVDFACGELARLETAATVGGVDHTFELSTDDGGMLRLVFEGGRLVAAATLTKRQVDEIEAATQTKRQVDE